MGSKRWMLKNGLGELLRNEAMRSDRFVDLFSGSGAVSWHIAQKVPVRVVAVDLQGYACTLAAAVVERTTLIDTEALERDWLLTSFETVQATEEWNLDERIRQSATSTREYVNLSRRAASSSALGLVRSYGGHYFSLRQSAAFELLANTVPEGRARATCLAAVIIAASRAAASPGHTAQPFQPTVTGCAHIASAWRRDAFTLTTNALRDLAPRRAMIAGVALKGDAMEVAPGLTQRDLVFVDPPYSEVQYSRFYHVLERIATGNDAPVSGVGRYPALSDRPQSDFSLRSRARRAMLRLLETLACAQATGIVTFPAGEASNGMSGAWIAERARAWFEVDVTEVESPFSTLGGNVRDRDARKQTRELIIVLRPKVRVQTRAEFDPKPSSRQTSARVGSA